LAGCGGGYDGCGGTTALYAGAGAWAAGRAGAFSGAPQLSQNASPGIAEAPHCGHITAPDVIGTAGAAEATGAAGDVTGCGVIVLVGVLEACVGTGISAAPH